jgi:hypothetical protein
MERGVYFDGWYRGNHCYHPSLPYRSMRMVEDIERCRGTLLVWSALGGGSISLPYLEHEAYGDVDPRLRMYGFLNDSEFIEECGKRGIKVFGIVFEVQGWEFPAVLREDDDGRVSFKALNVLRAGPPPDWYGLREFTSDKHWKVFGKRFADYFPDGLYNSEGERIEDLWEECCARTYRGEPVHADWVEVNSHAQVCYQMCRNNPVWREYLKKIIEIQIDAGVHGIQLDESELPMTSMYAGGCFCKDCMKGFREYLKGLKAGNKLCDAMTGLDLDSFDYGTYIIQNNLEYPRSYSDVPLFKYYWDYQLRQIKRYFGEIVEFAKEYSRKTRGMEIPVSGNFFNVTHQYFAMEPCVDVVITEMKNTLFRQPSWYRYAAAFGRGKPVIVAENPYGGIVPQLADMLNDGKGYDLYRILLLEASAYGCNMAAPYGSWMGNIIRDSFSPPISVTAEVQGFLAENERLFSKKSFSNVGVLWSFPSCYWREAVAGYSRDLVADDPDDILTYRNRDAENPSGPRLPFWEVLTMLSERQVCYDVVLAADGEIRDDDFNSDDIANYDFLILPDCFALTKKQMEAIDLYAKSGKSIIVFGRLAENTPAFRSTLSTYGNVHFCDDSADKPAAIAGFWSVFNTVYAGRRLVDISDGSMGMQAYKTAEGNLAVHLINYHYNKASDRVDCIPALTLTVRQPGMGPPKPYALTQDALATMGCDWVKSDDGWVLTLTNVPLYAVLEFSTA